jgi:hypothetical protein
MQWRLRSWAESVSAHTFRSGRRPLDRSVAKLNIEHYRRLLAVETDEARRKMLLTLLAEQEAKLEPAKPATKPPKPLAG